ELGRVQLLKLMLSGSNLLLLDEPTNHLDIASAEALETALEEYDGALLVVTHDRYLINRLADRVLYMTKMGLKEVYGGYDSFIASLEAEPANAAIKEEKPVNSYKAKKQKQSAFIRARTLVERAEREIMRLEETISK
ncbi:MAG TPA: ABC transporter ATP-binding protein, partial [Clostridia bacterium]|nr:ABC transporter ATP-binding protein [Clostridia bacterium]